MDYFIRQARIIYFFRILKKVTTSSNFADIFFSENSLYKLMRGNYFAQKGDPLKNKENLFVFPSGSQQFKTSKKHGRNLESMEKNLDFLRKEFNSYFKELLAGSHIKENSDFPPQYFLNTKSYMYYWEIGIFNMFKFVLNVIKIITRPFTSGK